jgi:WhiB family transcriptional regulator, redox-sensing transcriptional regulator
VLPAGDSTHVNGFTSIHTVRPIAWRQPIVALTQSRTFEFNTEDWREKASCRSVDPDLFFPVGTTGLALDQIEQAKAVCRACPSVDPCLEFALSTNQESGVWGATSEEERRKLRRQWVARQRQRLA